MYNKDFTYLDGLLAPFARGFRRRALLLAACDLLHLNISKIEKKTLVLIILVIVFTHKIKIKKCVFVYIQPSKLYKHVFS